MKLSAKQKREHIERLKNTLVECLGYDRAAAFLIHTIGMLKATPKTERSKTK